MVKRYIPFFFRSFLLPAFLLLPSLLFSAENGRAGDPQIKAVVEPKSPGNPLTKSQPGAPAADPTVLYPSDLSLPVQTESASYLDANYFRESYALGNYPSEEITASENYPEEIPLVGHLRCEIEADTNCVTKVVRIRAILRSLFTGIVTPVTVPWNTGVTAQEIIVTTPGFYTWTTAGFGCDHFLNTIEINEFFKGTIDVVGPQVICPGIPNELNVNVTPNYSFYSFQWSPANPSGQLTPYTIVNTGTYKLTVTDEMGCTFTDQITVVPNPPMNPILIGPSGMCTEGDTASISITPAFTSYQWENGPTTNPMVIYEPGSYFVTVTNQYGCTAEREIIIINRDASPVGIIATRPAICAGQLDTLFINGGYIKYEWSNGKVGFRNVIDQPGTYTITVTNQYGCTTTDDITINLLPTPTIGVSTTPLCPGGTATLSVTGGPFPLYKWSPGQKTPTITVSATGTYSVTVSGGGICPATSTVVVSQAPPPIVNIAPPPLLTCAVKQINLNAGGSSYGANFLLNWTTVGGNIVSGQDSLAPAVNGVGTYILRITNTANGCISSDTVAVTQNIALPGADPGQPATLTCATTNLNIGPAGPPPSPTLLPTWTTAGGNIVSGDSTWNPLVNKPGTYTLTVLNSTNGCTSTAAVTIGQNTTPPAAQIAPPSIITCTQTTVTLNSAGSSTGANFTYSWTTANGTFSTGSSTTGATATVIAVGTYTLSVTNTQTGCTATATTSVASDANIPTAATAKPDTLTCSVKNVTIDATTSTSGLNFTYTWTATTGNIFSGANTLTPTVDQPGIYNLLLLNTTNNCSANLTVQVGQNIIPPIAHAGQNDTLSCTATSLTLNGSGSSAGANFTYNWTTGNGNIVGGNATTVPTINKAGTYNLLVTNTLNGCTSTSSVQVLNDATTPVAAIASPAVLTCTTLQTIVDATASSQGSPFNLVWTGGGITMGQGTPQLTVDKPGTYTLSITNTQNGCTDVAAVTVLQNIEKPLPLAGSDVLINCFTPSGTVGSAGNPTGANFTLQWTTTGGNFTTPVNAPTAGIDKDGTYQLLITNTQNGCTATDEVVVTADFVPPAADAGAGIELNCTLTQFVPQGTGSTGPIFTYNWTTVGGTIVADGNTLAPTLGKSGVYTLLVSNTQNGCTATSSLTLTNNTVPPVANIAAPAILTCATLQTIVNASASSQGNNFNYTWSGNGIVSGQSTLQLTVDQPGPYTVTVTNMQNNCTQTASVTVQQDVVKPVPQAGPDVLLNCFKPSGNIGSASNQTGGVFTLQWTTTPSGNFTSPTNGPTASIDAIGTYQLLITNTQNGCTATDAVVVTSDFAQPAADAGPGTELDCIITEVNLQGTGSTGAIFTYLWTTSGGNIVGGNTTLTPLVDGAGTYKLLVSNTQNGCTATAEVVLTKSADVPDAVAGLPQTLTCLLTSTVLNGTGSTTGATFEYLWTTTGAGNIVSGANTLMPTINQPGTYVIRVLNAANNCKATSSVVIGQNIQPPVVDAGANNTLNCTLTSLPLQATVSSSSSQNLSYQWGTGNGQILSGGNTDKPTIGAPGIYTVTVTDAVNGCTGTDQMQIFTDLNQPVAVIAAPPTLTCTTLQFPLNASASSPGSNFLYNWTTQGGNFVSLQNPQQPVVDKPGIYNLTITNSLNGCTQTASATVTQNIQLPLAEAGQTTVLDCDDLTATLNGAGSSPGANFTYTWTTSLGQVLGGGTTLVPEIGKPGTYVITVRNTQNGCEKTDQVVITQDIVPPVVAIAPPQLLTCITNSVLLNGSGSALGGAPVFTWTTGNGNITAGANTLKASVNKAGLYTLTVQNSQNACSTTATVAVTQDITPPPVQAKPAPLLTCTVEELMLFAVAPPQAQLQWTTQNGQIVSGSNTRTPTVNKPGLYLLTVTAALNGCTATAQVPVQQETNLPTGIQFKLHPPLCTGKPGKLVVEQIQGGVGPFQYSIDGGQTFFPPKEFDKLQAGDFSLVIQDVNGCEVTQPIQVPPPPKPLVSLPTVFNIQLGEHQELEALVPATFPIGLIDTVLWSPLDGLTFSGTTVPDLLTPVAKPFRTTEYLVTILTPEGCKATARTTIRVDRDPDIYAPNIIKPEDADGDNSTFLIFARVESVLEIRSLQIYDRWGTQIFFNQHFPPNDPSEGWKGDFRGNLVNPAVFVWWAEVEMINGEVLLMKGDVTVTR